MYRPGRRGVLDDPAEARLDVQELVFASRMSTLEGDHFLGRVGFWFAYDRAERQWVLMRINVYDRPRDAIVMPPI